MLTTYFRTSSSAVLRHDYEMHSSALFGDFVEEFLQYSQLCCEKSDIIM